MEIKNIETIISQHTIIIPEIQREYVWGDKPNILDKFLSDIIQVKDDKPVNIGFLYRYSPYAGDDKQLYIIDGQQRFTTIILLLIFLARKEKRELPSYFSNFSYRVRSSSDEFLSQLLKIKSIEFSEESIKNYWWYSKSYDNDPTIQAIIGALCHFKQSSILEQINYDLIIKNIEFWVFDVNNTSQGEELYLSMNSRGEQLEDFENIKPLLFEKVQDNKTKNHYGKLWDNWENFFFEMCQNNNKGIEAVDIAMNNFVKIIYELHNAELITSNIESYKHSAKITLENLESYFLAFKTISEMEEYRADFDIIYASSKLMPMLKVLIAAAHKNVDSPSEIKRIYNTMENIIERRGKSDPDPLIKFLNAYINSVDTSFYNFALSLQEINLLDKHELDKIKICQKGDKEENAIWNAQWYKNTKENNSNKIWRGNTSALIEWSTIDGVFSLAEFESYYDIFIRVFNGNCGDNIDITRRALITRNLNNYPRYFKGYTNMSFGWEYSDWKTLINDNRKEFKSFFTDLRGRKEIAEVQQNMIDDLAKNSPETKFAEFAIEPELMKYCKEKNMQYHPQKGGWVMLKRAKINGAHANVNTYKLYLKMCTEFQYDRGNWNEIKFYDKEATCLFFDKTDGSAALDILCKTDRTETDGPKFSIELFSRKDKTQIENNFAEVIETINNEMALQEKISFSGTRYVSPPLSDMEIIKLLRLYMDLLN